MPTINLGRVVGTDGTNGTDGKSAYAAAVEGGYTGTEAEFYAALADIATKTELAAHTGDSDIHVTAEEKAEWNERDVFIATYGTTTSAEIEAAYQARKAVFCQYTSGSINRIAPLVRRNTGGNIFDFFIPSVYDKTNNEANVIGGYFQCVDDGWACDLSGLPRTHASTHASGGTDPITPESIGAKAATDSDVFVATYGTTTSAEIEAAYQAGKAVFCKWEINSSLILYAPLWYRASATGHGFACFDKPDTHHLWWFTCKSDKWGINDSFYADATHASTHASDGDDPITPESIGAAPAYTYGTEDLTAGTSELETGKLYFVFE